MGIPLDQRIHKLEYHRPQYDQTMEKMAAVRTAAINLCHVIDAACSDSRETAVAQTELESALMWAIKDLAINEPETMPDVR